VAISIFWPTTGGASGKEGPELARPSLTCRRSSTPC
jgi:hypothetical protein